MSWDILIQDLPDVATIDEVPDDFQPGALGSRAEVVERLRSTFPDADFSNHSWGVLDRADWSIEFNVGDGDPCESVMLHVRGSGADALAAVQSAIDAVGGRGLDMQGSGFFELDEAQASFAKWRDYRDKVVEEYRPSPQPPGFFKKLFGLD